METGCLMYTYFVATTFHQVLLYGDRMFDVHLLCCNYLPSSTALWRQDVWCTEWHLLCCNYLPSSTALWRQDGWCTEWHLLCCKYLPSSTALWRQNVWYTEWHLLCCNYLPSSTALWRQDVWCTLTLLQLPSIKYCSMETGCLMYGMTLTLL